jgi:hypothetical protein
MVGRHRNPCTLADPGDPTAYRRVSKQHLRRVFKAARRSYVAAAVRAEGPRDPVEVDMAL